jgi:hypothetical protein
MVSVNIFATFETPSLATTLSGTPPFASWGGVPLNVRVVGSKLSQFGSGDPSANVAVNVSVVASRIGKLATPANFRNSLGRFPGCLMQRACQIGEKCGKPPFHKRTLTK